MRKGTLEHGDRVEIYRNLHNDTFSVRKNGRVVKHLLDEEELHLQNVKFAVQPAGHAKVLREKKKNVHAFVRGTVINAVEHHFVETFKDLCTKEVMYNPYFCDSFFINEFVSNGVSLKCDKIRKTDYATLKGGKVYAAI